MVERLSLYRCGGAVVERLSLYRCGGAVLERLSLYRCGGAVVERLSVYRCGGAVVAQCKNACLVCGILELDPWSGHTNRCYIEQGFGVSLMCTS